MHAEKIVKRMLEGCVSGLHAKQSASILAAVTSVLRGGNLSLSQLRVRWNLRSPCATASSAWIGCWAAREFTGSASRSIVHCRRTGWRACTPC
jgi:hypothetical protein